MLYWVSINSLSGLSTINNLQPLSKILITHSLYVHSYMVTVIQPAVVPHMLSQQQIRNLPTIQVLFNITSHFLDMNLKYKQHLDNRLVLSMLGKKT